MGVNILLKIKDVQRTKNFYKNLGFEEKMYLKKEDFLYYYEFYYKNDPNYVLMFLQEKFWDFDDAVKTTDALGMIIYIPVKNIEAEYERLHNNVLVIRKLVNQYYGKEFLVQDPDGYKIAIFQEYEMGEKLLQGMKIWKK